jgi:hypothetical protein
MMKSLRHDFAEEVGSPLRELDRLPWSRDRALVFREKEVLQRLCPLVSKSRNTKFDLKRQLSNRFFVPSVQHVRSRLL